MIYLRRKFDQVLASWKASQDRLPIILRGARQVGKTETILQFAKNNYSQIVYVNFASSPKFKRVIENGYEPDSVLKTLSFLEPSFKFVPGETLLFFDEIQEFPDITTTLKFFKIDGRYDVICSGSLLGVQYSKIESQSVGYKLEYEMRSLDFEEYLWTLGYGDELILDMLAHMNERRAFSQLEWERYHSLFMDFVVVGGMPAVVCDFVEQKNFSKTRFLQEQIVRGYYYDIGKYSEGIVDKKRITEVFKHVVPTLAKEYKRFQLSAISKSARSREYAGCVQWLIDAGVVLPCYCLNFPELPLRGNYDAAKYKLYVADTGLLISMLDKESQEDLRVNKNLGTYKGAIYENFVAEAFIKSGLELYYYKRDKPAIEEDFFVRTTKNLVPVEVKSGKNQSASLRTLIASNHYPQITWGVKLSQQNIGEANGIVTFPYFCAFLIERWLHLQES